MNATGYCTQTCSKEYDRRRFCGVGSEYTGPDSVDCTGCATAKTTPKPCPSVCKCLSGNTTNGGIDVNAHGYCTQTCSKIYPNWHNKDPLARFCGVGSEYTGAGSVDCTGCADAHSAWYADTLCLPGGISNQDPYNPTHQRACAHLSEKKCVASPNCTFHSSCETSVPLSALAGHQNLFRQFPDFEGQSFTCSCDEALQFHQIQNFLIRLGVSGTTNSCKAKSSHGYIPGVKTWCQTLKTNQACMASSAICEDPHFATMGAFAEAQVVSFVDALKGCANHKCEACNAKSSGEATLDELMDVDVDVQKCAGTNGMGGRGVEAPHRDWGQ